MKELVVISGKGGTGKTSVVASFAALAPSKVMADCDVDAADLHLVLEPEVEHREAFSGGKVARVRREACTGCGTCRDVCRFDAIRVLPPDPVGVAPHRVDPISCEGCGVCARACPAGAIAFEPATNGEWYISRTRHGPMVHGRLGIAQENSGKMVSLIRDQARQIAEARDLGLVIIDGSPGVGCSVIASITGATLVLVVTEPTLSGLHDLGRVAELTQHFDVPTAVCVNKWDLNPEITEQIETAARGQGLQVLGRIRYDLSVTRAQLIKASVVEYGSHCAADDHETLWVAVGAALG